MNIKILDSWLREFIKTKANPSQIAEKLSLTSVSVEKVEEFGDNDFVYEVEVTTNRPDLASVVGLARETAAVLPHFSIDATFSPPILEKPSEKMKEKIPLTIINDDSLVSRVLAVAMEVTIKPSPSRIAKRLESADIRSLNNVIDVTNYVMRTIGHPTHVFDLDRIAGHTVIIRPSKKGEKIKTLDGKEYTLAGGDIVAEDKEGKIIDLLGVMGLENSVVQESTKRILFFIDNNDPVKLRKTSMGLGIRTEAAVLNEKSIDPKLAYDALLYGITLLKDVANAKIISDIVDHYPHQPKEKTILVTQSKINNIIGIDIPLKTADTILSDLGFKTVIKNDTIRAIVPSYRQQDMDLPEDLIEEIARIYGYHNIPTQLPPSPQQRPYHLGENEFYFEKRIKNALKYWGFIETYTYSMVSPDLYEGPEEEAIVLQNPLSEDMVYMRKTLVPSLLQVIRENKGHDVLSLFEISNIYEKKGKELPDEIRTLAGIVKKPHVSFYEVKGILEQLFNDLGVKHVKFLKPSLGGLGTDIHIEKNRIGSIEVLDETHIDFEINVQKLLEYVTLKKTYTPIAKHPPIIEDITFTVNPDIETGNIIQTISKQSPLITDVSLLDQFQNNRTFHITYQDPTRNLSSEDITAIREKIIKAVKDEFKAEVK